MSNIYIQEPPTNGKVVLHTTVGDIEIELWSKETPKACRNFVQLCMEGYYNKTIFHRLVKDFIVQGGDPTGTGEGGESIYGHPFKDEFHSRLRFVRRGLVAMANAGPHDNGSQFFFTLSSTPELQNKHTIFGKIAGDTIYNMIKLSECGSDSNDRPNVIHRINKTKVVVNPYDDIEPRLLHKPSDDEPKKDKKKSKATKDFKLLSFGDEAEEDEDENFKLSQSVNYKIKSSHDVLADPTLSTVAVPLDERDKEMIETEKQASLDNIRQKLNKDESSTKEKTKENSSDKSRIEELKKEAKKLKKELKGLDKAKEAEQLKQEQEQEEESEAKTLYKEFKAEKLKYKEKSLPKGKARENDTMALLSQFQSKLSQAEAFKSYDFGGGGDSSGGEDGEEESEKAAADLDNDLLNHRLEAPSTGGKVLDANIYDAERYELQDPRNPITKRRREESKRIAKNKKLKTDTDDL